MSDNIQGGYLHNPYGLPNPWATEKSSPTPPQGALEVQIGGNHYKDMVIQPAVYAEKNGLSMMEGDAIGYISRWRKKGGIQDLEKAKHCIDILIQLEKEKDSGK